MAGSALTVMTWGSRSAQAWEPRLPWGGPRTGSCPWDIPSALQYLSAEATRDRSARNGPRTTLLAPSASSPLTLAPLDPKIVYQSSYCNRDGTEGYSDKEYP